MVVVARTIILVGPPGSGKGTQAELLASSLNAIHLSSGQVLRDHASPEVQQEMKRGEIVQESEVDEILQQSLMSAPADRVWILDGFLRLPKDRTWLEASLEKLGRSIDLVIIIDVSEAICRERVLSRGRADDTADAWNERWSEFETLTKPVIENLTKSAHIRVDGDKDVHSINESLLKEFAERGITS